MVILDYNQINAIAGGAAGVTSAILVCPLDVIKVRMQSAKIHSFGTWSALKLVYQTEGYKGLYSGLNPTG